MLEIGPVPIPDGMLKRKVPRAKALRARALPRDDNRLRRVRRKVPLDVRFFREDLGAEGEAELLVGKVCDTILERLSGIEAKSEGTRTDARERRPR